MKLGSRIKKFREKINLSQEELADKIYTSRKTISNLENDKTYPDINSLKLLSNIFDVSLDDLVEGDIDIMKKEIKEIDKKGFYVLSWMYTIELILMVVSVYPLFHFASVIGLAIWGLFVIVTIATAFQLEKMKKEFNVHTYKEIISFYENKSLSHDEKNIEFGKRNYQRIFMVIGCILISLFLFLITYLLFEYFH